MGLLRKWNISDRDHHRSFPMNSARSSGIGGTPGLIEFPVQVLSKLQSTITTGGFKSSTSPKKEQRRIASCPPMVASPIALLIKFVLFSFSFLLSFLWSAHSLLLLACS